MYSKLLSKLFLGFLVANIASCKNYSLSVNDNVVYTPAALFASFAIADINLRNCVEQTITDKHVTKAAELKQLNCSNAGIKSLAGLETFTALEQLNLDENALTAAAQLSELTQLRVLSLRKNNLTTAEPLLPLLHLRSLDVSDNKNMDCGELKQLMANFHKADLKATLPEQCNKL